jgi:hypothetical protein
MAAAYSERMTGENNPNFGNHHPDIWTMPGAMRAELSEDRLGEKNPRWSGGSDRNGKWRFQTFVRRWVVENLDASCHRCGAVEIDVHHIVPREYFEEIPMSNFRSNLLPLCRECHRNVDPEVSHHLENGRPRKIPFADHLPEPILVQLGTDGLVSHLPEDVDLSPLGNVAEEVIPEERIGVPS